MFQVGANMKYDPKILYDILDEQEIIRQYDENVFNEKVKIFAYSFTFIALFLMSLCFFHTGSFLPFFKPL